MIRCLVHSIFFVPANAGRPLDRQGKISENNRHRMFIYIGPARSILDFGLSSTSAAVSILITIKHFPVVNGKEA